MTKNVSRNEAEKLIPTEPSRDIQSLSLQEGREHGLKVEASCITLGIKVRVR